MVADKEIDRILKVAEGSHYKKLNVGQRASQNKIKESFRKLVLQVRTGGGGGGGGGAGLLLVGPLV